ncbi:hypothetical protein MMC29_000745 [Sticta canariensis]|nr:hypothetical protein [Sticta canariensis]
MVTILDPSEYRLLLGEPVNEVVAMELAKQIRASNLRDWVREDLRDIEKSEEEIILAIKSEIEQNKIPNPLDESDFRPFLHEESNNYIWAGQLAEKIKWSHLQCWLRIDLRGIDDGEDETLLTLKIQIEQNAIPDGDFKDGLIRTWENYRILNRQLIARQWFQIDRECKDFDPHCQAVGFDITTYRRAHRKQTEEEEEDAADVETKNELPHDVVNEEDQDMEVDESTDEET